MGDSLLSKGAQTKVCELVRMKKKDLEEIVSFQANDDALECALLNDLGDVAYKTDIHVGMIRQHFDSAVNYVKTHHESTANIIIPSLICVAMDELLISARKAGYEIDKGIILDTWHSAPVNIIESWEGWDD